MGLVGTALIYFFLALYVMSNCRKHRKFPSKKTKTVISAKPKKRMVKLLSKVNIMNCYPSNEYRVIKQPEKWDTSGRPFVYLHRVGKCLGTERLYGARLQFDTGESVCIPFDCLEAVNSVTPPPLKAPDKNKETQNLPVVAQEVELLRGKYYKLLRKPAKWNEPCKYVGQTGKCLLVDDRGARLRFGDGNDISFQADVLEEAPAIDISDVMPGVLDEDDIVQGELYRIIKAPEKFGEGHKLLGLVGRAKWPNYRGVCIKFPDDSSYVIPYDCLERYTPPPKPNPVTVPKRLSADNIVIGRRYKIKSVPGDWKEAEKRYAIGQFAEVLAATDIQKQARVKFDNKLIKMIPFDCIEDLPRPTEDELIALIKENPAALLRIIQQINKVTKLSPVMNFCSRGDLPYCKEEAVTTYKNGEPVVYGPQLPPQHSAALLCHTVGEANDDMLNGVAALFNAAEPQSVTPPVDPVTETASED